MNKSKLYNLTSPNFQLPFFVDKKHCVKTLDAHDIPMLMWPDGRWCIQANIYMLSLFNRGLSRKNRGGTLLAYATNISHLIRYCYFNHIDFIDLTDNQFSFFIKTLQGERRAKSPEVMARDANSVIAVGRNCLDFLTCIGHFYNDENFIGLKGRIRAEQKEYEIRTATRHKGFGKIIRKYWHHRSFPTPDPKKMRQPISSTNISKLREAVLPASHTIFQRKRRYVMIKLLEVTGGRRSEVVGVTVESVRKAAKMAEPMLKLPNVKRSGGREEYRYVPISRHDLEFLLEFIAKNRRRIIRKTCGLDNDKGFLLISEKTGQKLEPNTITQEIHIIAKEAGIIDKTCPHMFRHRFITKIFIALIEQHQIENEDDFRRALLDTETMKQKIQQWTGHTDIRSLDVYIHLAFEETANFKKTYNIVNTRLVVDSFLSTLQQFREEIRGGESPYEASLQLTNLVEAFQLDLNCVKT